MGKKYKRARARAQRLEVQNKKLKGNFLGRYQSFAASLHLDLPGGKSVEVPHGYFAVNMKENQSLEIRGKVFEKFSIFS